MVLVVYEIGKKGKSERTLIYYQLFGRADSKKPGILQKDEYERIGTGVIRLKSKDKIEAVVDFLKEKDCKVELIEERSDIKDEVIPVTTPSAEEIYEVLRRIFAAGVRPSDKEKWLKRLSEPESIDKLKKIFFEK